MVLPVIDERVHQNLFFDDFLVVRLLVYEVAVVVVGDNDGAGLAGQVEDVAIVVTNEPAARDLT